MNDENSYKRVDSYFEDNRKNNSFGKSIVVPFLSGVVGSVLVVGTCFGVPSIRTSLIGNTTSVTSTASTNSSTTNINGNYVSLSNYSDTSVAVAQKVLPSIVGIEIEADVSSLFGNVGTMKGSGSGIIISNDGYILTNNHVVDSSSASSTSFYKISDAKKITVYLYNDETPYEATIVGQDEVTDIAVIKIEKDGLTPAELGDSDSLQIGEFVMTVGNPLGMQSSIACGNVSSTKRVTTNPEGKTREYIQTDAAINSGSSGGALVNSKGQVIGINNWKYGTSGVEGMCFAIPINSVKDVYSQLIQYNKVKRPYIGINGTDIDEKTAKYYNLAVGVYVKAVAEFSPAEKSSLKVGDVITAIDDKKVSTVDEINNIVLSHNIGDTITLKIVRDGKEETISITLAEKP